MKKRIAAVCAASAVALGGLAGPASANHGERDPLPPHCEHGQLRAAANAFEKGKLDQFLKHDAKAAACLAGLPPRSLPVPLP